MRSSARTMCVGLAICILAVYRCAQFNPRPLDEVPFRERAQTQIDGGVRVTAAVLSAEESKEIFDVPLYDQGIQPIWLEIENTEKETMVFLPISVDPDYFTPLEVAYINHFTNAETTNRQMDQYFYERSMGLSIPPGGVRSGFVFTNLDEGTKAFNVEVIGEDQQVRTFTFFIPVPGLRIDHHEVDWHDLYSKEEIVSYHDDKGLRKALESLPCCTTNKAGTEQGDPLNLVVIGDLDDVYHAFIRSRWDETEMIYGTSLWKTAVSFLFGGRYRYSPVSGLYVYGRPQDVALQKARETIHERNHLRLWLAPMRYEGKHVWVGQISRDIGVRFTSKTITTHKIDPDVDETRDYLFQDLWYSGGLEKFGYVKGVGAALISEPRANLTGDPYFTDGYRAVLWVSSKPIRFTDVEFVEWESPHER